MKENYLVKAFRETAATRFPAQAAALQDALQLRLQALRLEYAGAGKELWFHLENQILPGIAVYETLQTVLPKDEALQTVHDYIEQRAWRLKKLFLKLMRIPAFYKRVPGIFSRQTPRHFGEAAGFAATEIQTTGGVWRIDMTKCPYHDACVHYGCPELCHCFCDSDDITYDGLHEKLVWRRTKTLGRGDDCCDFCLKLAEKNTAVLGRTQRCFGTTWHGSTTFLRISSTEGPIGRCAPRSKSGFLRPMRYWSAPAERVCSPR